VNQTKKKHNDIDSPLRTSNKSLFNYENGESLSKSSIKLPPIKPSEGTNSPKNNYWQLNDPVKKKMSLLKKDIRSSSMANSMLKSDPQVIYKSDEKVGFDDFYKKRALSRNDISQPSIRNSAEIDFPNMNQDRTNENFIGGDPEIPIDIKPHEDVVKILRQISSAELLSPEDLLLSKRIHEVQGASREANHLLGSLEHKEALSDMDRHLLDYNDEKAGNLLRDTRRSLSNAMQLKENLSASTLPHTLEQNISVKHKTSKNNSQYKPSAKDKKDYYNKWYVPVKFWGGTHQNNYKEKAKELMKEDLLFIYNNIHNYEFKKKGSKSFYSQSG